MSTNRFRFSPRTNVPGDHRVSGRVQYTAAGNVLTIVEGKLFTVARSAAGTFAVTFGTSAADSQFFKGFISANVEAIVADPVAGANGNVRQGLLTGITTASNGGVTGFTFVTLNKSGVVADLADGDQFIFEAVLRDTEILV